MSTSNQQPLLTQRNERFKKRRKVVAVARANGNIGRTKAIFLTVLAWLRIVILGGQVTRRPRPWYAYASLWALVAAVVIYLGAWVAHTWWWLAIPGVLIALAIGHWWVRRRKARSPRPAATGSQSSSPTKSVLKEPVFYAVVLLSLAVTFIALYVFGEHHYDWAIWSAIALAGASVAIAVGTVISKLVKSGKMSGLSQWRPKKPASIPKWVYIGAAAIAIALAAGFSGHLITAASSTPVATQSTISPDTAQQLKDLMNKVDAQNNKIGDLQTQLNDANGKLQEQQAVAPVDNSTKDLTEGERAVLSALAAQGIDANSVRFGSDINLDWAKKVSAGGTTFHDAIYTPADVVAFLKSGTPEAKAALASLRENTKASDTELQNVSYWTSVQYTTPIQWNGNTFYVGGRAADGGSKVDPAGSVGIYYTGPQTLKLVSSGKLDPKNLFGFRGACANPQNKLVTPVTSQPQGNGSYTPGTPVSYKPPQGGGNPPPEQPPVSPPNNCTTHPDRPECKPTPPDNCTTHPEKPECKPKPPEDCTTNPNQEKCQPTPPKKCANQTGEFCGTNTTGGEQQPVQDNDPAQVAPTDGAPTRGGTEEVVNQQNSETPGGTDPTQYGTPGGNQSPGGVTDTPSTDSGTNPNGDGSAVETNPDAGASAGDNNTSVANDGTSSGTVGGWTMSDTTTTDTTAASSGGSSYDSTSAASTATDTGSTASDTSGSSASDTGSTAGSGGATDTAGASSANGGGSTAASDSAASGAATDAGGSS